MASCCSIGWVQFFSEGNPNIARCCGWLQSERGPKSRVSSEAGCGTTSEEHNIKMHNSARGRGMQNLQVNDGSFVRSFVMKTALVDVDFSSQDC